MADSNETNNNQNKIDIEIIKNDVDRFSSIFQRLETTIEKIVDITNSIGKVLAVHENRITQQEELNRQMFHLLEERRKDMSLMKDEIPGDIKDEVESAMIPIRKDVDGIKTEIAALNKTVSELSRWKYLIMGGGIVIGFLLSKISITLLPIIGGG